MISVDNRRLIDAARRSHFSEFARAAFYQVAPGETLSWNWHLDAICHHLELVRSGAVRRLIIEVPPRSLKSFLASVAFPAFCLGRDPAAKIISASYSLDLSSKLHNDCRALMRGEWYLRLFPHMRRQWGKDTDTIITTAQRGYRLATSTGGTLTGQGASLIILDDPMRSDDATSAHKRTALQEWFRNTVYSRLNDKLTGAIILVMQRLHIDDLAGHLRAQGGWTILSLPAIAPVAEEIAIGKDRHHSRALADLLHPAREPRHVLDDLLVTLGSYHFSAQYLQEPVPVEGQLVKWKWFRQFEVVPERDRRIVQSWDVASKAGELNDFSVCTTWAIIGNDHYLLDVSRARLDFPVLLETCKNLARKWRAETILIEDKGSGTPLIQQLQQSHSFGVVRPIPIMPTADKVTRMSAESATIEQGHVFLQAGAAWQADLKTEFAMFPEGRHDDQVDSVSQLLHWVRTRRTATMGSIRIR